MDLNIDQTSILILALDDYMKKAGTVNLFEQIDDKLKEKLQTCTNTKILLQRYYEQQVAKIEQYKIDEKLSFERPCVRCKKPHNQKHDSRYLVSIRGDTCGECFDYEAECYPCKRTNCTKWDSDMCRRWGCDFCHSDKK